MTAYGLISVAEFREDGTASTQLWVLTTDDAAHMATVLADNLGQPYSETLATADAVTAIGDMAMAAPGHVIDFQEQP